MNNPIAIIDCAINDPAFDPFNKCVEYFKQPFTYHRPPLYGVEDLKDLDDPLAYIILGSNSSVNDQLPWQVDLMEFLKEQCVKGYPVLGLCFGHQLMARGFGARIDRCNTSSEKNSYLGIRKIKMKEDFEEVLEEQELEYVVVHGEEIKELPDTIEIIAQSPEIQFEGIRHKDFPFVGFQGHPEATEKFVLQEIGNSPDLSNYQSAFQDGFFLISNFISYAKRTRQLSGLT